MKLQNLNLQLCRKINSTTRIFQLICLPFKNNCLSMLIKENFKKSKNFEIQCILCYWRCIALHFQLLQLVYLTDQWSTFYKTRISCLSGQHILSSAINKKRKENMKSTVWKLKMKIVLHSIWKECEYCIMTLLMPE